MGRWNQPHRSRALGDGGTRACLRDPRHRRAHRRNPDRGIHRAQSPAKIPLLQDGDFCIGESAAIVAYLSRTYSKEDKLLIPLPPRDYAAWLEWMFFIVAELDSTSLYVMRRHRADALGHIYGVAPDVVAKAGEYFRKQLRHVETALADGRTYLMGDRFTSADILLTTCLEWAIAYGVGICDNAHPYLERIKQRPAYQRGKAPILPGRGSGAGAVSWACDDRHFAREVTVCVAWRSSASRD